MAVDKYRQLRYTNRDFDSIRESLMEYVKVYFPDYYGDFTTTSTAGMLNELLAYVGDILSFYQDKQFNEIFNPTELKNAVRLLKLFGGAYRGKTQSNVSLDVHILVPSTLITVDSDGVLTPIPNSLPIIKKGMVVSTLDGKQFVTIEDCDFNETSDITTFTQTPLQYIIRKSVKAVSGILSYMEVSVSAPTPFYKIELPSNHNVLEIVSVVDGFGDDWYQVEYLAQDEIFITTKNSNPNSIVKYNLIKKKVPKRFIVETDHNNVTSLIFGSSNSNLESGTLLPNPSRFLVNNISDNVGFFTFNDNLLLNNGSLGLTPSNTTLKVTYLQGGGIEYNVKSQSITNILSKQFSFYISRAELDSYDPTAYNIITSNLAVYNPEAAHDAIDLMSIDDIKQLIPLYYASQKRAVITEDYEAILYSMPTKFGGVSRARAKTESGVVGSNDENSIALYILTEDVNGDLAYPSTDMYNNIKTYISQYKMLTDNVTIYPGEIINFGITVGIIVDDSYNRSDVITKVKNVLLDYFNSIKFNFGDSLYMGKIWSLVDSVEGVLSVDSITPENLTGSPYSTDTLNFLNVAKSSVITSGDTQVFELKFDSDVKVTITK